MSHDASRLKSAVILKNVSLIFALISAVTKSHNPGENDIFYCANLSLVLL